MALHVNDNQQEQTQKIPQAVTQAPNMSNAGLGVGQGVSSNTGASALMFGSGISGLMSATQGSDYTNGIAKLLSGIYTSANKKVMPKVHVLDKETFTNLAYSAVIVTMNFSNTVNYFVILLEETGRKPLTANEIINEWETTIKIPGATPMIYTADEAINNILHAEIVGALKLEYGDNMVFQSVDGIVLHKGHADVNEIAPMLATTAYNACYVETQLESGNCTDLNITIALQSAQGKQLRYESNMSKAICVNELGLPVRTDWKLDLCMVNNNNAQSLVLNAQNSKSVINRIGGFVDALPEEVMLPSVPGAPANRGIRFRPHIVLTSNSSETPTVGYMLLGVAGSIVMSNKNMWLGALRPTDKKVNVGNLNIIAKIDDGEGQRIDFTSKNYNANQVYAGINSMFSLDPVISVDVESFGPQSFYNSVLATAAQPGAADSKAAAAQYIIETANTLTGGRFPLEFNPNDIFVDEGVVIPLGTWSDKSGDRDIREIDLTFIASHTDDMNLINKWILSNLPMSKTGFDPYLAKIDIINKLLPGAEITGKAVRVTFTSNFITTLANCITAAGLNVRYEPEIKYTEDTNLSIMSSYLGNAGIGGYNGFAREVVQAGPSYQTPYINAGMSRYR